MAGNGSLFILGSFVVACSAKVVRFPRPGESLAAESMTVEPGGKGFNLMLGARRLGLSVDGLLAVGHDLFGDLAEPALARAGLPSGMLRRYGASTGSGIGFTDASGENLLAVFQGANAALSGADARGAAAAIQGAGLVLAQFEISDAPIVEAFGLARAAGVPTLLGPSPWRAIDPRILQTASILVVNRVEAAELAGALGAPRPDSASDLGGVAAALFARGPDTLVVTLGAEGAVAFQPEAAPIRQSAFAVEAVDTLGAGDAFMAGLAAGLVEGRSLVEALRRAAACGALATRRLGVFDALPGAAELDAFLAAQPDRDQA